MINPASGTIVMALGIFLFSVIETFQIPRVMQLILVTAFLVLGFVIYAMLTLQIFRKGFLLPFIKNPVNSFIVGSWIAGISIICDVIIKYFPNFPFFTQAIVIINSVAWGIFVILCLYQFIQLFKNHQTYTIHGVILLSAVATQSIVISWFQAFDIVSKGLATLFIIVGVSFYMIGVVLIGLRYTSQKWDLVDDWTNTNCILHGALSITGLALVYAQILSGFVMVVFWIAVSTILLIVEGIEIVRAVTRVKKYGWKKGIFTYNISQWSRNFTFGMFYAFTLAMHSAFPDSPIYSFQHAFMQGWMWIVLALLVLEIALWISSTFQRGKRGLKEN